MNIKSVFKYLQDRSEYELRYDRFTIEECRRHLQYAENPKIYKNYGKNKVDMNSLVKIVTELPLYFIKGDRYLKREQTINKWMERDKKRDEIQEKAIPPDNILCDTCHFLMYVESVMLDHDSDENLKPMFMFRCKNGCKRGKIIYEDGVQWENPSSKCPNCKSKLINHDKRINNKIIFHDTCPNCSYVRKDELDLTVKEEKADPNFERDKKRFCLSEEEGEEYRLSFWNIENMIKFSEEMKEREKNKSLYQAATKLKKLTVVELEKLLSKILEKKGYVKLVFDKPEIDQFVIIPFTVQDDNPKRKDRESELDLRKIINKILKKTNWRLMSEGMTYRLGYLYGRLKGYEREEDLIFLFKKNNSTF
jgi:hypothetical protein